MVFISSVPKVTAEHRVGSFQEVGDYDPMILETYSNKVNANAETNPSKKHKFDPKSNYRTLKDNLKEVTQLVVQHGCEMVTYGVQIKINFDRHIVVCRKFRESNLHQSKHLYKYCKCTIHS